MRSLMLLVLVMGCSSEAGAQPAQAGKPVMPGPPPPPAPTVPSPQPLTLPGPAETPSPHPIGPRDRHPVGAIHIPCTVEADVAASVSATQVRAKLVLRNLTPRATTVTLRASCPDGPLELVGLPDGFDPMHGCQKRCSSETATVTFKLPARGTRTVADTLLKAKGDACNPPLPLGSMFLTAAVTESADVRVCSGAGVHVIRDPRTKRLRKASLNAPAVPAELPPAPPPPPPSKPLVVPTKPEPQAPKRPCPVCAFACVNGGEPSQRTDENGCRVCGCDKVEL